MRADDPRHGSLAGYRAHDNSGTKACDSCREAKNAYARAREAVQPARKDFTNSGYDPNDGLLGGRWMFDDERRCQVWVEVKVRIAGRVCEVCELRSVGVRATRCRACRKRLQKHAVAA